MLTTPTKQRLLSSALTYYGAPVAVEPVGDGLRFSCTRPIVGRTTVTTLDGVQYTHPGKSAGFRNREANKVFALWCIRAVGVARDLSTMATMAVQS
jgi:hypothetical protein